MHEELEDLAALDAVGATSEEEALRLQEHLQECESCLRESIAFEGAASLLALQLEPVQPPASARAAVMEAMSGSSGMVETLPVRRRRGAPSRWLAAAAVLFLALFAWSELRVRALREEMRTLQAETASARGLATTAGPGAEGTVTDSPMATIVSTGMVMQLEGKGSASAASARAFIEPEGGKGLFVYSGLPSAPQAHAYQLWVLHADAPPTGLATFSPEEGGAGRVEMENLQAPVGFAVTIEPAGGVPAPTGEMVLEGRA